MIWFSLFIPFILSILFLLYFNKDSFSDRFNSDELKFNLVVLFVPTLIVGTVMLIMNLAMISNNTDDVEYLSYYYTKIYHEDKWNERVWVTKTRTVTDSKGNTHTETYQVRETRTHPEKWYGYLNNGSELSLTPNEYYNIRKRWNVPEHFIDKHRDYYTIDGDAQEYIWDNNNETIKTYVKKHHYTNKVIGTETAFKFNEITQEEAKTLGLYDYPNIDNNDEQDPIIGYKKFISLNDIKQIKLFNALNGYKKQIGVYILIYPNTSSSIVEDQRSYWQGGNKNEFVICVGIDSLTNKVQWSQCFSWLDDITMEVECRNFINSQDKLNITVLNNWLEKNSNLWKRKEFSDFNYLNVSLTDSQEITILWTVIILSLIMAISGAIMIKSNDL